MLLKIFFGINYHDKINGCNFTKLTGMRIKKKKAILNKHEDNYTSKVEKSLIVNDFFITILIDATLTSPKNDIFNLSVCLNDCHKKSTRHKETIKMFIAYINLLYFGAFFIIVASIVLRQLFLQEIW